MSDDSSFIALVTVDESLAAAVAVLQRDQTLPLLVVGPDGVSDLDLPHCVVLLVGADLVEPLAEVFGAGLARFRPVVVSASLAAGAVPWAGCVTIGAATVVVLPEGNSYLCKLLLDGMISP